MFGETSWARDLMMLLATIDPVGTLTLFVALTAGLPAARRPRIAVRSILIAAGVLVGFLLLGQVVLGALGIGLATFSVSGGIVLFLFGLQMIFGNPAQGAPERGHDMAVFPLAIPSIASPGAILAVVVLTDNDRYSWQEQMFTFVALIAVLGLTLGLMLLSNRIHSWIGATGSAVLIRVMGLLLCALAAEMTLNGLLQVFAL